MNTTATNINNKQIPVTVITGFLGSGKTTLLSDILSNKDTGKRIAVIENEYGTQLGVHNEVNSKGFEHAACVAEIFETSAGCICCSGKQDFERVLYALINNKDKFDYIIVETTGLADPTFTSIFEQQVFKDHLYLDGIITLVDAKNVRKHLVRAKISDDPQDIQVVNECIEQITYADKIILNKIDLVSDNDVDEIEKEIKRNNETAEVLKTKFSKVELSQIIDIRSFSIDTILKKDPGYLNIRPYRQHDSEIGSLTLIGVESLNLIEFEKWLANVLSKDSNKIYRVKGVLSINDKDHRYILQGVHEGFSIHEHLPWDKEQRVSKIVFIGKGINANEIMKSFNLTLNVNYRMDVRGSHDTNAPSITRLIIMLFLIVILLYPDQIWEYGTSWISIGCIALFVLLYRFWLTLDRADKQKKE